MNALRWLCVVICAITLSVTGLAAAAPVVPGYQRLKADGKATEAQLGELLLAELNCVACHKPSEAAAARLGAKQAPDLSKAGARLTPQFIRAFLSDPHTAKPGTMMPTIFHASEPQAKAGAVEALTHYLVSLGGPLPTDKSSGDKLAAAQGKRLYHTLGCVACHAPEGAVKTAVDSVPLENLAGKTSVQALASFLQKPHEARPSGRMPDFRLDRDEAYNLAVYLLREQLDNPANEKAPIPKSPGIAFEYYPGVVSGDEPDLSGVKPKATGTTKTISHQLPIKTANSNFTLVFKGAITIPKAGEYTFWAKSDDASFLYIGSKKVVDNPGMHGPIEKNGKIRLEAGDHPIRIVFTQGGGGYELSASWAGPGFKKQAIATSALSATGGKPMLPIGHDDFAVDPQKIRMGSMMFSVMGCASCHDTGRAAGPAPPFARRRTPPKPLAELVPQNPGGCLSAQVPKGRPQYNLSADQRQALIAALSAKADLEKPRPAAQRVLHRMAQLNCLACHTRDNLGGPGPVRDTHFKMLSELDLGDEGRIPPTLDGAGDKFKPEALRKIVSAGELHVRPHMATRMPGFHDKALGSLLQDLLEADRVKGPEQVAFDADSIPAGRRLAGTKGLACITCHNLAGHDSLSIHAVDLATTHARLNADWFIRYLNNPQLFNPRTRMPPLWPGGQSAIQDVLGGDARKQQVALWNYLSLGKSMPLPAGLKIEGTVLTPTDEPIVFRTFMNEASPRAIAIGYPEQVHVAFDANAVRMAKAWKGAFFDAKGTWNGRAGQFMSPSGEDILDLPAGPALAYLPSAQAPWPRAEMKDRNVGGRFKGYRYDAKRMPILKYVLEGTTIEEQPIPRIRSGGVDLIRHFDVSGAKSGLYLLAAEGQSISKNDDGTFTVDGKLRVGLKSDQKLSPTLRSVDGKQQLLLPVASGSHEVILSW